MALRVPMIKGSKIIRFLFWSFRLVVLASLLALTILWVHSFRKDDVISHQTVSSIDGPPHGKLSLIESHEGGLWLIEVDMPPEVIRYAGFPDMDEWSLGNPNSGLADWFRTAKSNSILGVTWGRDGGLAPSGIGSRFIRISYWMLVSTLVLLSLSLFANSFLRRLLRRPPQSVCPRCGYDMRATPYRCPECGTELGSVGPGDQAHPQGRPRQQPLTTPPATWGGESK
jgi:hypothetical protein